ELVALGREHDLPVMEDLGSGSLVDLTPHGFPPETHAASRVATGVDLVCFSGDKLLGGPQAGLALGRRAVIDAMRANPLARALRLDAMTLAALDWTLDAMLEGRAEEALPALAQLLASTSEIEARAAALADRVRAEAPAASIQLVADRAPVGGGSLPGFELESRVLEMRGRHSPEETLRRLRQWSTPIVARVRDDAVCVDVRTVFEDEMDDLADALASVLR
ncbi:MAG: L-seryl-tRNA(Sec) selenium transferase, partial [Actinomycetota bacterium]|nr:L-seryl-tRNA(Sec) selenium transferase [Actinomycetota bacterium]